MLLNTIIRNRSKKNITKLDFVGWLFVLPAFGSISVFFLYSVFNVLIMSFQKMRGFSVISFSGFLNYIRVLQDSLFWNATWNTFEMTFYTLIFGLPISLVLAILINDIRLGKNLFKSLFFIPSITSLVATSLIFYFILHPSEGGLANYLLIRMGLDAQRWFSSPRQAAIGIVAITVWRSSGYNAIIWLTGILSIPSQIYEAAAIDGASKIKQWLYITIPQLKPVFLFLFLTNTIFGIRRFTEVYMIGGLYGAPASALDTLVLYVYRSFNGDGISNFGRSSAASILVFVIILIVTFINNKVLSSDKGMLERIRGLKNK